MGGRTLSDWRKASSESAAEIGDFEYKLKRLCPRRMGIPQVARWLSRVAKPGD